MRRLNHETTKKEKTKCNHVDEWKTMKMILKRRHQIFSNNFSGLFDLNLLCFFFNMDFFIEIDCGCRSKVAHRRSHPRVLPSRYHRRSHRVDSSSCGVHTTRTVPPGISSSPFHFSPARRAPGNRWWFEFYSPSQDRSWWQSENTKIDGNWHYWYEIK